MSDTKPSDAQPSSEGQLLPELQFAILSIAGRPLLCRELCRELSSLCSQQLRSLTSRPSPGTKAAAVMSLVGSCTGLERLDLRNLECVDDELVAWVLQSCTRLQHIDVSTRERLTARSLALFRSSMPSFGWRAEGCWRMHAPHPSLSAREVLAVQLLALRGDAGTGEGIAACFGFASPANQQSTGPVDRFSRMIRGFYGCMLRSQTARIACVGGEDDTVPSARMLFLVGFRGGDPSDDRDVLDGGWLDAMGMDEPAPAHVFIWELSRQSRGALDGCWMTDAVRESSLTQYAFMDPASPLPQAEEALGEMGGIWYHQTRGVWQI